MAPFATLLSRLTALTFIVPVSESFHIVTTEAKTAKPQHLAIASAVQPLRTGDGNRRDSINVLSAASGRTCPLSLCARTESTSSVFGVRCSRLQRGSCSVSCHASQDSRGVDAMDADGQENEATLRREEEERLRAQVFANEKGFLESTMFNPGKAKEEAREKEVARLSAEWDTSPDKVSEIVDSTSGKEELDFQELERISTEMNMTDAQQRAFMLNASMRKLDSSTKLPRRRNPKASSVEALVSEQVFAEEQGFQKNSKEFKEKLKAGSGVRFGEDGFPVMENDPVMEAARKKSKERQEQQQRSSGGRLEFSVLPDCPSCSTPTAVDELSRFGMCIQCKADKVSANAYGGPSAASKYTYDNGDAPFSRSWNGMGVDQPPSQPASPAQQIRDPGTSSREAPGRPIPTNFRPTRAPMTSSKATGERDAAILAATATTPDPSGSTMPKSGVASPPSPPGSVGAPTVARGTGEHTARPPNNGHNKAVMVDITGAPLAAEQVATGPHTTGEDGTGGMDATSTGGGDVSGGGMQEEARGRQDSTRGIALAVRALTKEVSELRDQLASARKEEAITRSALRKLQEEVAVLRERGVSRA